MLDEWVTHWDQPIGTLIENFVDLDVKKEEIAQIQAELLALHTQQICNGLPSKDQTNLFKLLEQGRDAIQATLAEWSVSEGDIATARTKVDSGAGMPGPVPTFGLIAKISGFVKPEACDELLTTQAAARILKHANMKPENAPRLDDAGSDRLFNFIGKNEDEPDSLVEAQCYAHIALIYKAALEETGGKQTGLEYRFASIAHSFLIETSYALNKMRFFDAVLDIESALVELNDMKLPEDNAELRDMIKTAVGYEVSKTDSPAQVVATDRFRTLQRVQQTTKLESGGGKPPGGDIPKGPQMV